MAVPYIALGKQSDTALSLITLSKKILLFKASKSLFCFYLKLYKPVGLHMLTNHSF